MAPDTQPVFWRDPSMKQIELRYIKDGHNVRYTPHSHEQWSLGAILDGHSSFLCGDRIHQVSQGDLVIMNAHEVHACNPQSNSPWSYYMLHLDCNWLGRLLLNSGQARSSRWKPTQQDIIQHPEMFEKIVGLCQILMSSVSIPSKSRALQSTLLELFNFLKSTEEAQTNKIPTALSEVAYYLIENSHSEESIEEVAMKFEMSSGYLTRQFKRYYQLSPHAFRLNRRIQLGQIALKNGVSIIDVASQFGFSDQAHFQRTFKERVAATPKQYKVNRSFS